MQLRPCFHQALLARRQLAADQFDGIDAIYRDRLLIISVKMWRVMRNASFHIHADDDSKEPAQFRHDGRLRGGANEFNGFYFVPQSNLHLELFALLGDCTKPAINCGIISKSFRLTTSTGECM